MELVLDDPTLKTVVSLPSFIVDPRSLQPLRTYSKKRPGGDSWGGEISSLVRRREQVYEDLRNLEEQIYDAEEVFLFNSEVFGNIFTGLDLNKLFEDKSGGGTVKKLTMSQRWGGQTFQVYDWERLASTSSVRPTFKAVVSHVRSETKQRQQYCADSGSGTGDTTGLPGNSVPIGQPRFHKRQRGKWKLLPQREAFVVHKVSHSYF